MTSGNRNPRSMFQFTTHNAFRRGRDPSQHRKHVEARKGQIAGIVDFSPGQALRFGIGNVVAFVGEFLNGGIEEHTIVAPADQSFDST